MLAGFPRLPSADFRTQRVVLDVPGGAVSAAAHAHDLPTVVLVDAAIPKSVVVAGVFHGDPVAVDLGRGACPQHEHGHDGRNQIFHDSSFSFPMVLLLSRQADPLLATRFVHELLHGLVRDHASDEEGERDQPEASEEGSVQADGAHGGHGSADHGHEQADDECEAAGHEQKRRQTFPLDAEVGARAEPVETGEDHAEPCQPQAAELGAEG